MTSPSAVVGDAITPREAQAILQRPAKSYFRSSVERLLENRVGVASGAVILLFGVIALAAPLIIHAVGANPDPATQDLARTFDSPTHAHLLGTDELGRDTLVRLVYGAQVSYTVALLTVAISVTLGSAVGLVAGFYGKLVDTVLMRAVDTLLSIPFIFLLILVAVIHPLGLSPAHPVTLAVLIAIIGWGGVARLVRGEVLTLRSRDYMVATRAMGAVDLRLILRHLLPNVAPILIVAASLGVGGVILTEAALDFIGLGIQPPTPSWGNMLTNSQVYYYHSLWLVFLPGSTIFATVLAMNLFGNAIRDAFDPRLK